MLLALDIGNTNIVVGCCREQSIVFTERIATNHTATEFEYAMLLKNILEIGGVDLCEIDAAVMSSVVPGITNIMKTAVNKLFKCEVLVVGQGVKTGLKTASKNTQQLGADLVVDAVAGIKEYGAPLIIIDMGTATTVSVVDKDKSYLGTVIMPGVEVSLNSLVDGTSQLPKISLEAPEKVIGTNTVDCMKSGIMYGSASGIDGIVNKIRSELGINAGAVATGGLANVVIPLCENDITVDNDLLLKGLMEIYSLNR